MADNFEIDLATVNSGSGAPSTPHSQLTDSEVLDSQTINLADTIPSIDVRRRMVRDLLKDKSFRGLLINGDGAFPKINENNKAQNRDGAILWKMIIDKLCSNADSLSISPMMHSYLDLEQEFKYIATESRNLRKQERNISFANDFLRAVGTGVFVFIAYIVNSAEENEIEVQRKWYLMILLATLQAPLSFAAACYGYRAGVLGHKLEWNIALIAGMAKLLDSQEGKRALDPNQATEYLGLQNLMNSDYLSMSDSSFGGLARNLGTALNCIAGALTISVFSIRVGTNYNKFDSLDIFATGAAISGVLISHAGKRLSYLAAQQRKRGFLGFDNGLERKEGAITKSFDSLMNSMVNDVHRVGFNERFQDIVENGFEEGFNKMRNNTLNNMSCGGLLFQKAKNLSYLICMKYFWGFPDLLCSRVEIAMGSQRAQAENHIDSILGKLSLTNTRQRGAYDSNRVDSNQVPASSVVVREGSALSASFTVPTH